MNLFLALPIADRGIQYLRHMLDQHHPDWKDHPALRWTKPEDYHLTLHFFGPILPEKLSAWISDLGKYIKNSSLFYIQINKIENFPKENSRILAGHVVLSPSLGILYYQVEHSLQDHHFPVEERPFCPHVTFCRAQRKNILKLEPILLDYAFTVQELVLYQSQPEGYFPLHRWRL